MVMKIELEQYKLKPHYPFRISREVQSEREIVVVVLTWEGYTGFGEASPSRYYGEDSGSVAAAASKLHGKIDGEPEHLKERVADGDLRLLLDRHPSFRAGLDIALWDIIGKKNDKPVFEILGLDPTKTPATSFTIGLDSREIVDRKVDDAEPYKILKMKMGLPGDMALLDRVLARSGKIVRVDANEGWDIETAIQMCGELGQKGVEFVEQPIHHDCHDDLCELKRLSPLPIILDESIRTVEDIPKKKNEGHGINIKLMKCGGITPALKMIEEARRCQLKVMLGCMIESSIGITAASHLSPLVDYADLDGNLLVANDPFEGVTVQNGKLVLPVGPGLGVTRRASG